MNYREVEMPPRIAVLDRDHRGYPIPFVVTRNEDGRPYFAANDSRKTLAAAIHKLCHICGQELPPDPWFVGGPGNALGNGDKAVYIDGPLHQECMHYALRVCPYLTQLMSRPLELQAMRAKLNQEGYTTIDNTVLPGIPPIFLALQARTYDFVPQNGNIIYYIPKPYKKVEYWKDGELYDKREGEREAKRHTRAVLKDLEAKFSS
jgi:hypothetical protein